MTQFGYGEGQLFYTDPSDASDGPLNSIVGRGQYAASLGGFTYEPSGGVYHTKTFGRTH